MKKIKIPSGISIPDGFEYHGYYEGMVSSDERIVLGAPSLESVDFVENISDICDGLFAECSSLKSMTIPESVKSIGAYAFRDCDSLEQINLPNGVSMGGVDAEGEYGGCIFEGCSSLKQLSLPGDFVIPASDVRDAAVLNAPSLESVILSDGLKAVPSNLFLGCESLKQVDLPDTIEKIDDSAFSNRSSLEYITLPDSVKEIGNRAFSGCSSLSSVRLPSEGFESGTGLFSGCESLKSLEIAGAISPEAEGEHASYEGILSAPALESVALSERISSLPDRLFKGCSSLESMNLPGSVRRIGQEVFSGCTSLESVVLPDSVKEIGNRAFSGCSSLSSVRLPSEGFEMQFGTFEGCASLKSIEIPDGIAGGEFAAPALESVTFAENVRRVQGLGNCTSLKSVTIPEGVRTLGSSAFSGCTSLEEVDLPQSLREISNAAFYGCTALESIVLPEDVSELSWGVFKDCKALKSVKLPTNIRAIQMGAFESCESLEEIEIPHSVQLVSERAFYKCCNLREVTITPSTKSIENAFELSGLETIRCVQGSAAERFANSHGYSVEYYTDATDYFDLSNASIDLENWDMPLNGLSVEPKPTVYVGNRSLIENHDYTVSYEGNDRIGEAALVITGKGSFHGSKRVTFGLFSVEEEVANVSRIAGDEAWDTAAAISKATFDQADTVVLARWDDFADAMSATGFAGAKDAPILLTQRDQLSKAAADEIARLGAKDVYIAGGNVAIQPAVDEQLKALGVTVHRVAGNEMYDTSVEFAKLIAQADPEAAGKAIVAYGQNFQDALSISSFAYKYHVPIFLQTYGDHSFDRALPATAVELLKSGAYKSAEIYVPGGEGAVSKDSVEGTFGDARVAIRIGGEDGFETSGHIAFYMAYMHLLSPETVLVANGAQAPKGVDALAGAAMAGTQGGVMLLVNGQAAYEEGVRTDGLDNFLRDYGPVVKRATVLGGEYVMPESVVSHLRDALG